MADPVVASLLAHQGGWDEFLFAAGPIVLIGGLLWLANKRATQLGKAGRADADATTGETRD